MQRPAWSGRGLRRGLTVLAAMALLGAAPAPATLVIWAWERPEDLRFAAPDVEVAVHTGFVELRGDRLFTRGRRFPLRAAPGAAMTSVVHVQIDRSRPLIWTPELRARTSAAVLGLAAADRHRRVQIDFEVRASERHVLLDVLDDVRAGLPAETTLSMTALASWCETERWLDAAPVDEIVPMLFRMGPDGWRLKARLAAGGDFANPRCRSAYAVATDAPLTRAPTGRRIYLFSPRSWTGADFKAAGLRIGRWADAD